MGIFAVLLALVPGFLTGFSDLLLSIMTLFTGGAV